MDPRLAEIIEKAKLARSSQEREDADRRACLRRTARIKEEMNDSWLRAAAIMEQVSQTLNGQLEGSGITVKFSVAKQSRVVQFADTISAFRFTTEGPDFSGEISGEVTIDGIIKHEQSIRGSIATYERECRIDDVDTEFVELMLIDFIHRAQSSGADNSFD
jgi:hypothetical protein